MQLLKIAGIRIGVDFSWFLVLFLAIFWLQGMFRDTVQGSQTTAYLTAVAAAFLLFGSIVLHELGHALAARREGITVTGIDLFFFGGVMKMARDTDSPGAEFRVAVAGPLATLLIALVGGAVGILAAGSWEAFREAALLEDGERVGVALLLLSFVVPMNVLLLVFNLIPAYPLDGGRIARAAVWKATGDRARATRAAAMVGRGFGYVLIALGIALAVRGEAVDGIWLAVLGWLLAQSARGAVAQTQFTQRIAGITVADIMDPEPVAIPALTPAVQALDEYFLRYHGSEWFPVVDESGRYVGRARRAPIETVAASPEGQRPVRDFIPPDDDGRIGPDTPLEALLGSEPLARLGALTAVDERGHLTGVVTREQVTRALRARLT